MPLNLAWELGKRYSLISLLRIDPAYLPDSLLILLRKLHATENASLRFGNTTDKGNEPSAADAKPIPIACCPV